MPSEYDSGVWDSIANAYDSQRPDHSLTDPAVRAAWAALLTKQLPADKCRILDVGCGTGSLSLLLAEAGHSVTGIDFAPEMIAAARHKAETADFSVIFEVQDASAPTFAPAAFDAIICRQTLWALPNRKAALETWSGLLVTNGQLILVEGLFASGKGMSQAEILTAMPDTFAKPKVADLSQNEVLWGGPIPDQRLLITTSRL